MAMKNILDYLEKTAQSYPQKIAFLDGNNTITFSELVIKAKQLGTSIAKDKAANKPYLVYISRSINCIVAMLGIAYSGNFYVVIDTSMPNERLEKIVQSLNPVGIVEDAKVSFPISNLSLKHYICGESLEIDEKRLAAVREKMIDTDPLYALYTSGSTGTPKGAIVTHRNVISYIEWVCSTFDITADTVWGSQAPFYFSMSITDVYSTIVTGATLVIIQRKMFMFPLNVLKYLCEKKVNTLYWVPSALSIMSDWRALERVTVPTLGKILFAGEAMPTRVLNAWRQQYPYVMYANLFGPTETTDICTYYVVDREFKNDEALPIGKACNNCDVFVINDGGLLAQNGEEGELYVRGSFIIPGYYNNPEKTEEVFVQNPLNKLYPEIVYKTGDIVKWVNDELHYIGRKDFQIKRMGYRIELGEIEVACGNIDGVLQVCCFFSSDDDRIVLAYTSNGNQNNADVIRSKLSGRIPAYMMPDDFVLLQYMPINSNGKIDRKILLNDYLQKEGNK